MSWRNKYQEGAKVKFIGNCHGCGPNNPCYVQGKTGVIRSDQFKTENEARAKKSTPIMCDNSGEEWCNYDNDCFEVIE